MNLPNLPNFVPEDDPVCHSSHTQLYDWSNCCDSSPDTSFFGFMRTLFGYYSSPTNLMVLLYWMYWTGVLCLLAWKLFRGTLYGIISVSPSPLPDLESGASSLELQGKAVDAKSTGEGSSSSMDSPYKEGGDSALNSEGQVGGYSLETQGVPPAVKPMGGSNVVAMSLSEPGAAGARKAGGVVPWSGLGFDVGTAHLAQNGVHAAGAK